MARVETHFLAYVISGILQRRLRSAKVGRPKQLAEDITPAIMDEIPIEAFEQTDPSDRGYLIFHGDVDEDRCRALQEAILETHINVRREVPISLMLSTMGGDVYAGLALAGTIQYVRREGRKVNAYIQGYCMSMGTLIAQVCDFRSVDPNGWMMIHELNETEPPKGIKTSDLKDLAESVERTEIHAFSLYAARSGRPVSYWRKRVNRRDVYLSAEEALREGLVDEIATVPPYRRPRKKRAA